MRLEREPTKKLQSQNKHSRGFWLSTKYLDTDQINAKCMKRKSVNIYTPTVQYPDSFVWLQVDCASLIIELTITRQNKNVNYYVKAITNNKRRGALESSISCNTADETKLTHLTDPRGTVGLKKGPDKNRQNKSQR